MRARRLSVGAGALARILAALPVQVSSARVDRRIVRLADYPGGGRPSSVVCLAGAGQLGFGENVAFSEAEHTRFALDAERHLARAARGGAVAGGALGDGCPPYARAALEAALVDLAMRQAGVSLAGLTGAPACVPLHFVVSFAAPVDPRAHVRRLRAQGYRGALKVDVDPAWDRPTCAGLAGEAGIAILDFKGHGDAELARTLAALFPAALLEDPPAGTDLPARTARDATLAGAGAVALALEAGEAVNLKAPRMGGPLEVLRALALLAPADETSPEGLPPSTERRRIGYLGGMFEVGVGRAQARQLAALFCAHAPNDLAPLREAEADAPPLVESPPVEIRLDTPGFGP